VLFLQLLVLGLLLSIFAQDIFSRSLYWICFPVLAALLFVIQLLSHESAAEVWVPGVINIGFLTIQLLVVSAYFSLKYKRWVNVTQELIGWGDVLFLLSISFYLSVLNFLFFYVGSLLLIVFGWFCWQLISGNRTKQIPLAGLQALLLAVLLVCSWWYKPINLNDDYWLMHFLIK